MDGKFIRKKILNLLSYIDDDDTGPIVIENEDGSIVIEYYIQGLDDGDYSSEYFHILDRETNSIFRVDVYNYDTFLEACDVVAQFWNKIENRKN